MLGRKTVLALLLAGATAVGGGVAVASAHGGGSQSLKPPKLLPMKQPVASNLRPVHHCHLGSGKATPTSAL